MFVQKKMNRQLWILLFFRILGGKVGSYSIPCQSEHKIVCLSKFQYIKSSSGIPAIKCLTGITEEIFEDSRGRLDRLNILDFGGEFEQRFAVNLEVFDESHRTSFP